MRPIRLLAAALATALVAQPAMAHADSGDSGNGRKVLIAVGALAVAGGIVAIATSGGDDDDKSPVSP